MPQKYVNVEMSHFILNVDHKIECSVHELKGIVVYVTVTYEVTFSVAICMK